MVPVESCLDVDGRGGVGAAARAAGSAPLSDAAVAAAVAANPGLWLTHAGALPLLGMLSLLWLNLCPRTARGTGSTSRDKLAKLLHLPTLFSLLLSLFSFARFILHLLIFLAFLIPGILPILSH